MCIVHARRAWECLAQLVGPAGVSFGSTETAADGWRRRSLPTTSAPPALGSGGAGAGSEALLEVDLVQPGARRHNAHARPAPPPPPPPPQPAAAELSGPTSDLYRQLWLNMCDRSGEEGAAAAAAAELERAAAEAAAEAVAAASPPDRADEAGVAEEQVRQWAHPLRELALFRTKQD